MNSATRHCLSDIKPTKLKPQSSEWLIHELLKRSDTDIHNGDICLFHYPHAADQVPYISYEEMQYAFRVLAGNVREEVRDNMVPSEFKERSSVETRNLITRIQFCWYQFPELPRIVNAYANIQHVDIRQNASLKSIDSIIAQLPNLASLNLSDCPNIQTLSPLAASGSKVGSRNRRRHHDRLALKHLWVRGCNLNDMTSQEWANVFDALAGSTGPLERLTLSRNNMSYLHGNVGKLASLTYMFVEDNNPGGGVYNDGRDFVIPEEIGQLQQLLFVSLCGNNIKRLPQQMAHLKINCDVYLHRNPNLQYPPVQYQKSISLMRRFFHEERMKLLRGAVLFMPHLSRARLRANERLYQPGGTKYFECKERFEESVRRTSLTHQ